MAGNVVATMVIEALVDTEGEGSHPRVADFRSDFDAFEIERHERSIEVEGETIDLVVYLAKEPGCSEIVAWGTLSFRCPGVAHVDRAG